jgi:glycosyltransferase involved in cell wall biosynthesis
MKLIGFLSVYNEVEKRNLRRCLESMSQYCDEIVIYDDASTDNSVEVAREFTDLIIEGKVNEWGKEAEHRQQLLELALTRNPDWIFWMDADEVVEKKGEEGAIRELCETDKFDSYAFHEVNLWRTTAFYRVDNSYNDGLFCRLWKNNGMLQIPNRAGLHQRLVPDTLKKESLSDIEIIHYGFSSDDRIIDKYITYRAHGQSGWALDRLIDERTLDVRPSRQEWFKEPLLDVSKNDSYKTPLRSKLT